MRCNCRDTVTTAPSSVSWPGPRRKPPSGISGLCASRAGGFESASKHIELARAMSGHALAAAESRSRRVHVHDLAPAELPLAPPGIMRRGRGTFRFMLSILPDGIRFPLRRQRGPPPRRLGRQQLRHLLRPGARLLAARWLFRRGSRVTNEGLLRERATPSGHEGVDEPARQPRLPEVRYGAAVAAHAVGRDERVEQTVAADAARVHVLPLA